MANESEFETVISEADVESGVIQPARTSNEPNTATKQVQMAPVGRWGIFSLNFLQQYFDVTTQDIKNRLMAAFVPFKGKTLFEYTNEKPDLFVAFCVSIMFPMFMIARRAKSAYLDDFLSSCMSSIVLYGFLLCCCAVFMWFMGPMIGLAMGVVASISFSSYLILVAELICITPLRYIVAHIIYLCVIVYFNFKSVFTGSKKVIGYISLFAYAVVLGLASSFML